MPRPLANIYRDRLTTEEHQAMNRALKLSDLKHEIALVRTRISSLAAISDPKNGGTLEANRLLCRMLDTLAHLVSIHNRIAEGEDTGDTITDFNKRFVERQRAAARNGATAT